MENEFTDYELDNIMSSTVFDTEDTEDMILYTYTDKQTAKKLFTYFFGLRFNTTQEYKSKNPLQIPLILYDTPEIAKIMATQQNTQLVALSINTRKEKVYDVFNPCLNIKLKRENIGVDDYKLKCALWREKDKYNGFEYIVYTVRSKDIIDNIQLQE